MKRYAIVRVDNNCPMWTERFSSFTCEEMFRCSRLWQIGQDTKCRDFCRYGDTKEQMVRKIAQVLYRDELRFCIWKEDIKYLPKIYERCLEKARKVVEFLGVEE